MCIRDSIINSDNFTTRKMVSINDNQLFLFSNDHVYIFEKNIFSDDLQVNKYLIGEQIRKDVIGFENIALINENTYLIGSTEGYLITDFSSFPSKINKKLLINQVQAINILQQLKFFNPNAQIEVPYDFNTITFEFSLPSFANTSKIKYRYLLDGYNENWSEWASTTNVSFGNLQFGDYNLKIEAKLNDNEIIKSNRSFAILRPWYVTNPMIILVLTAFILFIFFINKSYERYYSKIRLKLIDENNQKMELVELRNSEKLIQLENQNLEENIQSKNRELAIATMAIVKKNQFLKAILQDLENLDSNPLVTRVIRVLKRNSKKDDDWQFFKEAFDNSDKDFLKNLKLVHPKLTPNDMRLCAYLRLNLSSKEIAPLFNISAKSVEIKRYRLRKRMGLGRVDNLVDYIIKL